jgi:hypothetical protein
MMAPVVSVVPGEPAMGVPGTPAVFETGADADDARPAVGAPAATVVKATALRIQPHFITNLPREWGESFS